MTATTVAKLNAPLTNPSPQGGIYPGTVLNAKQMGAKGDGVTLDNVALASILSYIATLNYPVALYLPAGRYRMSASLVAFRIASSIRIYGDGKFESVLAFEHPGAGISRLVGTASSGNFNIDFENFGVESDWGVGGDFSSKSQLVLLDTTGVVNSTNMRYYGSNNQSFIVTNAAKASCTNSLFQYGRSDGCRFIDCIQNIVSNNHFDTINDDVIAIHTTDAQATPVRKSVTVTGNSIVDCQGIAILGAKNVTVTGNTLNRPLVHGIYVGCGGVGTTEGNTTNFNINITGNSITDVFKGTTFRTDGGGGGTAVYIHVVSDPPTTNGLGYVWQGNGSGAVVQPYPYFYTNNVDAVPPAPGTMGINVSGNTLIRTLEPTGAYSNYGFGVRTCKNGPVDPAITYADLGNGFGAIQIDNHMMFGNITNNIIWGADSGIFLNGTASSAYNSWGDLRIAFNDVSNWRSNGLLAVGEGYARFSNNNINGDPLNVSPFRGANGTWQVSSTGHTAINQTGAMKLLISNNDIANVGQITNLSSTTQADFTGGTNRFYGKPTGTISGFSTANVGIGNFQRPSSLGAVLVYKEENPTNVNFGRILNTCVESNTAMPSAGYYAAGHFVRNSNPSVLGSAASQYVLFGWERVTSGTGHVLNTDWYEVRTLTGT